MAPSDSQAARGSASFGIATKVSDAGLVLALSGEFDLAAVPIFEEVFDRVADHDDGPLLLDLGALSFLDSSGVSSVVRAMTRLQGERRRLSICDPRGPVETVLRLTGLLERLPRVPCPSDAIAWPAE